jgi:hypothetical protein
LVAAPSRMWSTSASSPSISMTMGVPGLVTLVAAVE